MGWQKSGVSFLDRIAVCRRWNPADYRPFVIEGRTLGRLRHNFAKRLADFPDVFRIDDRGVTLAPTLNDFERRTDAVAGVIRHLIEAGDIGRWRGEAYPVVKHWDETPLMAIDRGAVPDFGTRGFGVHVNGLVEKDGGLHLWVGRRARDKATAPGKLDHIVAGGQPHGLSIAENLIKESAEEANIPAALARTATPVGMVTYRCAREEGLRDDVLFCYDLLLPPEFTPRNTDGEVEEFFLWPIEQVIATVRDSDDFKFNVNLVIIDLLVRRGLLAPDEPGYMAILEGLRLPN